MMQKINSAKEVAEMIAVDHEDWLADLQEARIERERLPSSRPEMGNAHSDPQQERMRLLAMFLGDKAYADRDVPRTLALSGLRNAQWINNVNPYIRFTGAQSLFRYRNRLRLVYDAHSRMTRDLTFKVSIKELDIEFKANSRKQLIDEAGRRVEAEIWRRFDSDLEIPMPIRTASNPDAYELVPIVVAENLALECLRRNWQLALIVLEAKHALRAQQLKARRREQK